MSFAMEMPAVQPRITIPGDMPSLDREEIENIIHDHETVGYHSEMNR